MALTHLRPDDTDPAGLDERARRRGASGRRAPVAVIALLVAVVSALGFAVWARDRDRRAEVLVAAHSVEAGQMVRAQDVRVARLALGDGVTALPASRRGSVVGLVATTRLPAGALLTSESVAPSPRIAPGDAIVGIDVAAGQSPVPSLSPGTTVEVVLTPAGATDHGGAVVGTTSARIYAVSTPGKDVATGAGASGAQFVSLLVPAEDAAAIVAAAATDRAQLVVVGGTG